MGKSIRSKIKRKHRAIKREERMPLVNKMDAQRNYRLARAVKRHERAYGRALGATLARDDDDDGDEMVEESDEEEDEQDALSKLEGADLLPLGVEFVVKDRFTFSHPTHKEQTAARSRAQSVKAAAIRAAREAKAKRRAEESGREYKGGERDRYGDIAAFGRTSRINDVVDVVSRRVPAHKERSGDVYGRTVKPKDTRDTYATRRSRRQQHLEATGAFDRVGGDGMVDDADDLDFEHGRPASTKQVNRAMARRRREGTASVSKKMGQNGAGQKKKSVKKKKGFVFHAGKRGAI